MSAIKLLEEAREYISLNEKGVCVHNLTILARINALLATGGWIAVTERLPEKNTDCLVFIGWVDVGTYAPTKQRMKSEHWYCEPAGINPMFNVTHWQPLPLPPLPEDK